MTDRNTPLDFSYETQPARIVFRPGAAVSATPDEAARLGLRRVLVVCGSRGEGTARAVADALGGACAGLYAGARMHVPVEVADRAVEAARAAGADGCVAVGGGSAIGLGKAIALRTGLPLIAVPSTYSGSEMTPVWGLTEHGAKRTGRDPAVQPRSVVYDPELTLSLPVPLTVTSGVNALAHAVEALYAPDASPLVSLMAEEGVRAMTQALPLVAAAPEDLDARGRALYGAWLCGACLGATTMGLHHKLCHVLGGTFGLPHAETHTVVLPYALAYNAPAAPRAVTALSRALGGADDVPHALWALAGSLGAPRGLAELGLKETDLAVAAEQAAGQPYPNPREVTVDGVLALLTAAYQGREPSVDA
ncbi:MULTISPECIES: maleylacetate reductase [Streptomyces]|uniref:Maleylacetate reductase n=1 Tax=Streptomyces mirabilis TaxID=68239 RepID=A0ABU3UFD8_9ACTN|nr:MULTISPECIES: maleylacetate reductase [Streptomyces]MCX4613775.1 maleylacetate reductase [Streptomyces mirabilis]MDU8992525.1 maleylacetate reductase [Streptomyces mirabilis]QDN91821.1 maleylacetate reductase [Streptomyces sp. RLB3-6]QDO12645.1 maleylacetate reductase [Streptomyces sp. S1D4-23]